MILKVTKIGAKTKSRDRSAWKAMPNGGESYYRFIFFTDGERSWRTHVNPDFGNGIRWKPVIEAGAGSVWDNLRVLNEKKRIIDADSWPKEVRDDSGNQRELFNSASAS